MRGFDERAGALFSYVDLEKRVHADHPLRAIRSLTNAALSELSRDFAGLYSGLGRPSIAPEMLLRAMLLQAFYSVRSERQLMERLERPMRSPATDQPNSRTTARSRLSCPSTMATTPSLRAAANDFFNSLLMVVSDVASSPRYPDP